MERYTLETSDKSFIVEVPITNISGQDVITLPAYAKAMGSAMDEIEVYKGKLEYTENQQIKQLCEMSEHIKCLQQELDDIQNESSVDIPLNPIDTASYLINHRFNFKNVLGQECEHKSFDNSELRQIAEHLLVYCNNNSENVVKISSNEVYKHIAKNGENSKNLK